MQNERNGWQWITAHPPSSRPASTGESTFQKNLLSWFCNRRFFFLFHTDYIMFIFLLQSLLLTMHLMSPCFLLYYLFSSPYGPLSLWCRLSSAIYLSLPLLCSLYLSLLPSSLSLLFSLSLSLIPSFSPPLCCPLSKISSLYSLFPSGLFFISSLFSCFTFPPNISSLWFPSA